MNTLITPSDGKIGQIKDLLGQTLRNSGLNDDGPQLIIEQGGIFQQRVLPILLELATQKGNDYAHEKIDLSRSYPKGWRVPSLAEQSERLLKAFPGLYLPEPVYGHLFHSDFDGAVYHVFPERLGLLFGIPHGNAGNYGRVIHEIILPALAKSCKANGYGFHNCLGGELGRNSIRLDGRGRAILQKMQDQSQFDAFVGPVSLGELWRPQTYSPRNARELCSLNKKLLPQGLAQVGCHLVAMPDRLTDYDHLWIDCPGDECNWDPNGNWDYSPYFFFDEGRIKLRARYLGHAYGCFGSAVAHLEV